jgi:hypothetical protein
MFIQKGEVIPFVCPCGKAVPFTDGDAVCECGHVLTEEERDIEFELKLIQ